MVIYIYHLNGFHVSSHLLGGVLKIISPIHPYEGPVCLGMQFVLHGYGRARSQFLAEFLAVFAFRWPREPWPWPCALSIRCL